MARVLSLAAGCASVFAATADTVNVHVVEPDVGHADVGWKKLEQDIFAFEDRVMAQREQTAEFISNLATRIDKLVSVAVGSAESAGTSIHDTSDNAALNVEQQLVNAQKAFNAASSFE